MEYCKEYKICLLYILETKVKRPSVDKVWDSILLEWRLEAHQSGRLWVGWDPLVWEVEVLVSLGQVIIVFAS